ncbi:hypothetical protein IQ249_17195 [Lusitaniella coriacea LEGE 07157]|uniref:PIN domain-containing protein n=1 Tax=Lusitaniella coriacea LEGE 07157 TaxID=945747 RepID=A0A8J7DY41_9CYAN|nr:hypothetical protein [Lusitaniella coriacea]MBE9117637.1 hypothetical protein [Lusitaniella coriacea LEGE 07157]
MRAVAIVDTSIFCNVLNIPHMNGERKKVMKELEEFLENGTSLLLPMAAVYETGNHIAQLSNGNNRRRFAEVFVEQVKNAIAGDAPWQVMQIPTTEEVGEWLSEFPNSSMRGASISDLSIIKEWEKLQKKIPNRRVFIWSLDSDLQGYDRAG